MAGKATSPGSVIDGRYRIEKVLGEGAVGMVVRAIHLDVGAPVAMKFLLPRMRADPVVVERFAREARASALITGEHVARVFDVGSTEETGPYIVMEYLSGETVSDALKRRGMLPIAEACNYMVQVCAALAEAHARGIIHRDLKPANLFLTAQPDGQTLVKVLDFGISKMGGDAMSSGESELTMASTILGTPLYMAPEQIASSRTVDGRADIWSCGVCLHRMLSGSVPFDADSLPALGAKLLTSKAPNLRTLRPGIPASLADVVLRCLERDVNLRWQTAEELAAALEPFAGRRPSKRPPPRVERDVASLPTIAIVEPSEAETSADLTRVAARALASREAPIVDVTLNEIPPLGVARRTRRSSTPPPAASFEEELPTIRLSSPPVSPPPSRRTSRRTNRPPPPNAGPMLPPSSDPPPPPPYVAPPLPPPGPISSTSAPIVHSSRTAPTVRVRDRGIGLGGIENHPYFGVGLVVLLAFFLIVLTGFAKSVGCLG